MVFGGVSKGRPNMQVFGCYPSGSSDYQITRLEAVFFFFFSSFFFVIISNAFASNNEYLAVPR